MFMTKTVKSLEDITFLDIFDLDELQRIQDAFTEATGLASIITDPDGNPITEPSNFCRLCMDIIRASEKGAQNCIKSDAIIGALTASSKDGRAAVRPCLSGGLWDGSSSIKFGDKLIANWLCGQVRDESFDTEKMLAYAKEIGVDKEEFRSALEEVQVMTPERFAIMTQMVFLIAQLFSKLAYERWQKDVEIAELKERLESLSKK
jgi:ligand-binding sensor protein